MSVSTASLQKKIYKHRVLFYQSSLTNKILKNIFLQGIKQITTLCLFFVFSLPILHTINALANDQNKQFSLNITNPDSNFLQTTQSEKVQNTQIPSSEKKLAEIIKNHWLYELSTDPFLAINEGEMSAISKLPNTSLKADQERKYHYQDFLEQLNKINPNSLSKESRLNYELLQYQLKNNVMFLEFDVARIPFLSDAGFHTTLLHSSQNIHLSSIKQANDYLERLKRFPHYIDQAIANMQRGLDTKFIAPLAVINAVSETIHNLTPKQNAQNSPFLKPLLELPDYIPKPEKRAVQSEGKQIIQTLIRPAFLKVSTFLEKKYKPNAKKSLAARDFPNGEAYYKALVKYYTNLDLDPKTVHQIGLNEVKRIRDRMEKVKEKAGYQGNLSDFIAFLRTDDRFYAKTKEELLKEASWISKQAEAKLPEYFTILPRLPFTVEPVPKALEANYTTGRYVNGGFNIKRPGAYWVNTYDLRKSPLYELPALTLHEAVPGHHLQTTLAQEMRYLPNFRRYMYPHAFGEGWGLYAEKLGEDFQIYKTPYEEFGRLSYEMWRACRLVSDTGIHWKRWNREKAKKCFIENSALSEANIENELDRYISWPGQALAYKIGELKIIELRQKAEQALGNKFDIRKFHDAMLAQGSVPLKILEKNFNQWLKQQIMLTHKTHIPEKQKK